MVGRAWHPTENRAITVREAATLQSYPSQYEFLVSLTDQYKQVGNAVPGKMAKAVALAIAESLRFVYAEESVSEEADGKVEDMDGDEDTSAGGVKGDDGSDVMDHATNF